MTTYHETSCTECEALKLGDCATCDASKWRTIQNAIAWLIALEMIVALTFAVAYATYLGSSTDSFLRFGSATYTAKIAGALTFVGLVLIFLMREKLTAWIEYQAKIYMMNRDERDENNYEDEDDEE